MFRWSAAVCLALAFFADWGMERKLLPESDKESVKARQTFGACVGAGNYPSRRTQRAGRCRRCRGWKGRSRDQQYLAQRTWRRCFLRNSSDRRLIGFGRSWASKAELVWVGCLGLRVPGVSAGYLMYRVTVSTSGTGLDVLRLVEGNAMVLCAVVLGWADFHPTVRGTAKFNFRRRS